MKTRRPTKFELYYEYTEKTHNVTPGADRMVDKITGKLLDIKFAIKHRVRNSKK